MKSDLLTETSGSRTLKKEGEGLTACWSGALAAFASLSVALDRSKDNAWTSS